jgi:hypothetical protein
MLEVCTCRPVHLLACFFTVCLGSFRSCFAHEDLTNLKLLAARADDLYSHHKGSSGVYTVGNTKVNAQVNAVGCQR